MSTLKNKAQDILDEKIAKIKPENIKEGVTVFDVTGTAKTMLSFTTDNYMTIDFKALSSAMDSGLPSNIKSDLLDLQTSGVLGEVILVVNAIYDDNNTSDFLNIYLKVDEHGYVYVNSDGAQVFSRDSITHIDLFDGCEYKVSDLIRDLNTLDTVHVKCLHSFDVPSTTFMYAISSRSTKTKFITSAEIIGKE